MILNTVKGKWRRRKLRGKKKKVFVFDLIIREF